jgi:hypothetical protein
MLLAGCGTESATSTVTVTVPEASGELDESSDGGAAWQPSQPGYELWNSESGVWYSWVPDRQVNCGETNRYGEIDRACWQIRVVSGDGCPGGIYGELNYLDKQGTVVGYTNDSLPGLAPEQVGLLTFDWGPNNVDTGEINKLTCHR